MQGENQTNTPLPTGWAISLPSCLGGGPGTSQQVSGKVVGPSRVGAAGSPWQTVSNHAEHSTSFHSETQSQTYSRTAVQPGLGWTQPLTHSGSLAEPPRRQGAGRW